MAAWAEGQGLALVYEPGVVGEVVNLLDPYTLSDDRAAVTAVGSQPLGCRDPLTLAPLLSPFACQKEGTSPS